MKITIDENSKMLHEMVARGIDGVENFVQGVADELHQKRVELNSKYTRKFSKVKDVIAKYFDKYDIDMEELKINMKILNQKYADWSKILIEPTSLNEARVYALETRLHEEEDIRIKEQEYMRDILRKLVFSLEQTSLQNIEIQGITKKPAPDVSLSPTSKPATLPALPNLLIAQGTTLKSSQNSEPSK